MSQVPSSTPVPGAIPVGLVPPEVAEVRAGENLDWVRLEAYLREQIADLRGAFGVLQFPNGSANLTYLLRFGGTELVMRRPPFGVIAPGAHDMKREFRVLSRLWKFFDKAPRAYVFCDDHDVVGSDFVVMERRVGEVVRFAIPESMRHHDRVGHRIGLALTDAMAELHLLDPVACEMADLGKPEGFTARQVNGWKTRWDLVRPDGPDGRTSANVVSSAAAMDEIHTELERTRPAPTRVSFVHNDLKPDNCQFRPNDPDRVGAIFDWDMTTVGEPLVDVGTLLSYWPDPSDAPESARGTPGAAELGLPTRAEIAQRYASRTGASLADIQWYEAFALWKTGVVVQQLHHRWVKGDSTDPRMQFVADRIVTLVTGARHLLDI